MKLPSIKVVEAVAKERGTAPRHLGCVLQDSIDTVALNKLFSSNSNAESRGVGRLEFPFCGCWVSVYDDGTVEAERIDDHD